MPTATKEQPRLELGHELFKLIQAIRPRISHISNSPRRLLRVEDPKGKTQSVIYEELPVKSYVITCFGLAQKRPWYNFGPAIVVPRSLVLQMDPDDQRRIFDQLSELDRIDRRTFAH